MIKEFYIISLLSLICGYFIDLIVGDPKSIPHPICFIGTLIIKTEKLLRKYFKKDDEALKIAGIFLLVIVLFISAIIPCVILILTYKMGDMAVFAVQTIMCWQILATKSLAKESMKVYTALEKGTLRQAQYAVSMIVGRDTEVLDKVGVAKATIETVAENTCDGVIAPILYCAIGGPVLGFIYKAINTMDSTVGYKNEKYIHFGKAAAKLDDAVNYIPARLSALLMLLACPLCGLDIKNGFRIWKRDKRKHASPNSAQTESVCAGAINIQLAGDAVYGGNLYKKDFIGDLIRPVENNDIKRVIRLMQMASFIFILIIIILTVFIGKGQICL